MTYHFAAICSVSRKGSQIQWLPAQFQHVQVQVTLFALRVEICQPQKVENNATEAVEP